MCLFDLTTQSLGFTLVPRKVLRTRRARLCLIFCFLSCWLLIRSLWILVRVYLPIKSSYFFAAAFPAFLRTYSPKKRIPLP